MTLGPVDVALALGSAAALNDEGEGIPVLSSKTISVGGAGVYVVHGPIEEGVSVCQPSSVGQLHRLLSTGSNCFLLHPFTAVL